MSDLPNEDLPPDDPIEADFLGDVSSNGHGSFFIASQEAPDDEPLEDEAPIRIGDGECAVCGAPTFRPPGLTKTGRQKRAPKYCELHDPKLNKQREFSIQDVPAQLRKIQDELTDDVMLFGTLTGPLFPTTGYYIVDNAEQFTTALLKLCQHNPRIMRVLHRAGQVAPVYQVAKFGAGVGIAVQVDQGKTDPHSMASQRLGVDRAYDAVHGTSVNFNQSSSGQSNSSFSGPPKYATVQ